MIFDPEKTSFETLLAAFFSIHDPTTPNRQGPDIGSQYRSAIFYLNEEQRKAVEHAKKFLEESNAFNSPIITEITPAKEFFEAESYHQKYYLRHPGVCR